MGLRYLQFSEFTQILRFLCLKLLLDISEGAPKQKKGEAFGMSMNNTRMGYKATTAKQNLVLEKGMSEM